MTKSKYAFMADLWPDLAPRTEPFKLSETVCKVKPKKHKRTATVLDCEGEEMASATYSVDEFGRDVEGNTSLTWASEEEGEDSWDELRPLPNPPKCKKCKVCGSKHYSNCSRCPHAGNIKSYKTYEESPCSDCGSKEIGNKVGHGKVFSFLPEHDREYIQPDEIERDAGYDSVLDICRGFASLNPQEFYAYILTKYFSLTQPAAGAEMSKEWKGETFNKIEVRKLVDGATAKLAEVIDARILRGKILESV